MKRLDILQKINNILYYLFGDADIVINLQVYINKKRYQTNTVDSSEVILYDHDKQIVK